MILPVAAHAQEAVQWTTGEGGNGHWYAGIRSADQISWNEARMAASRLGGHLATIGSEAEDDWIITNMVNPLEPKSFEHGPLLGGYRTGDVWYWVTGEPWNHEEWCPGEPAQSFENFLHYWRWNPICWNNTVEDTDDLYTYIVEWSADCNNDGIVDYGQILDGTLVDTDQNGVPDWCDSCTGDVNGDGTVDAADLGALLALWGTNGNSSPRADANRDGTVDAADLGLLLGYWGVCP